MCNKVLYLLTSSIETGACWYCNIRTCTATTIVKLSNSKVFFNTKLFLTLFYGCIQIWKCLAVRKWYNLLNCQWKFDIEKWKFTVCCYRTHKQRQLLLPVYLFPYITDCFVLFQLRDLKWTQDGIRSSSALPAVMWTPLLGMSVGHNWLGLALFKITRLHVFQPFKSSR